ncbi:DUF2273 domain-containing protein [Dehalobacter sp. DCM]|uniref:DUF2273 domain-containing protein n=1 Tax=Dehalobacter sp. DCM TaxID=2907827 RepID=UPI0030814CFF|nr:DUF2273 domain-containing protein [Dehalobacter sp. DCM]
MGNFWRNIGEKITLFFAWCLDNHPGKLFGFLIGFFLALAFIILGFWQTLLLVVLSFGGYFLGKCWDDGAWPPAINSVIHRISFRGKDKR